MTDPEITQADRDLVASLLDADDELVEQINAGLAFSAECICAARHRIAGARAMQEAAAREISMTWLANSETASSDWLDGLNAGLDRIRSIDPASVSPEPQTTT